MGLFFAIDESDAGNYFWDEFEALERQCFWASRPSLKTMVSVAIREPEPWSMSPQPNGSEGRFEGACAAEPLTFELLEQFGCF